MHRNSGRYSAPFILIHWLLALLILMLIAMGLYIQFAEKTTGREYAVDVHVSLGLTALILAILLLLMRLIAKPPPLPDGYPAWLAYLGSATYLVIYVCLLLIPVSGYLQAVARGSMIRFWGFPLPAWGPKDPALAEFFWTVHGMVVFVLIAFVIIHIGLVLIASIKGFAIASRMFPGGPVEPSPPVEEAPPGIAKIAFKLARSFRIYGWIAFWLQLALAFISGLLLVFAASGRTFSPGSTGLGDGMFWAKWAFLIIWLSVVTDFFYTRAASKIRLMPDTYINPESRLAFWFLGLGILFGMLGLLASLTGVGASISLLVAKTVSQPPGIAITDPNKIIRALDVFILLVNFSLLMAHFIGSAISLWLSINATNSRIQYHKLVPHKKVERGPEMLQTT
jgi:cytochrome b561